MFNCHLKARNKTTKPARAIVDPGARLGLVIICATLMTACATKGGKISPSTTTESSRESETGEAIRSAASDAAVQPLRDFGMVRRKIPAALARIGDPYAPPTGQTCEWINYEVQELDEALQSDVGAPAGHDERSMATKGSKIAKDGATEAMRGVGSMLVPQRSLIRLLTGASKADRLYAEAVQRGMVRRGYLRGLAESKKC